MKKSENKRGKKSDWEPFQLTYVGKLSEVVLQGNGKLSPEAGDPGEPGKPPGHDPGG